jgi:hypothetical protein
VNFLNHVPVVDVATPANPLVRASVDFSAIRQEDGTGIAADATLVYLTTSLVNTENGVSGNTRLYIGQYLAPTDTAGIAPTVQITAPAPGAIVIEDDVLPITATATDDVAVASVDLFVAGALARTVTAPPYQHTVTVPTGVTSLTIGATAIDFGNNLGVAPSVTVNVIPDPGTTVTGRTVNQSNAPIPGATVTCLGVSGTSAADGTFSIPGVPTIRGNVQCSASALDSRGRTLTGSVTDGAPVRGGTTAVGNILLALRVSFAPGVSFPTGPTPFAIQMADFNRDGALDLVTASSGAGNVGVLLGNGNGTFQARQLLAVGPAGTTGVSDVAVGDLNGDGNPDIVSANSGTTVSVLLGRGDGTFLAQQSFTSGNGPNAVAIADFDGDGTADVVCSNRNAASVSVLLGNGDGTLAAAQAFTTPTVPGPLAVGDVDGNGTQDVIVLCGGASGAQNLPLLLGNGDGTLQATRLLSTGVGPSDVAIADMNADGRLDVLTTHLSFNNVSVLLGNGNGTFAVPQAFAAAGGPLGLAVADANRDGFPDAVTGGFSNGFLDVLLGEGNGTLLPQQQFDANNSPTTDPLRAVAVGDLNGDMRPDIAAAGQNASAVYVLLQQ